MNNLWNQAQDYIKQHQYDKAKDTLETLFSEEESAPVAHALGEIAVLQNHYDEAINCFECAIELDEHHIPSYLSVARLLLQQGLSVHAIGCYAQGILANPEDMYLKEWFLGVAALSRFSQFNPQVKALYLQCIQTKGINFSGMGPSSYSLLQTDPVFGKVLQALEKVDYQTFKRDFSKLSDPHVLMDSLFISLMKTQTMIAAQSYENFLTNIRHWLLDSLEQKDRLIKKSEFVTLAESLAHYCFYTEYIFECTDDEQNKIDDLLCKHDTSEEELAVLACYKPLYSLTSADKIETRFASSGIHDLIVLQITNYKKHQEIKASIDSLTAVSDQISLKVKEQYEDFPYPRWVSAASIMYDEDVETYLRDQNADILVAGCGTGWEAIELALSYPESNVLAIDLSCASLAYGIHKAQDLDLKNITFKQADILELKDFGKQFDFVASSGVLHHMRNPEVGWHVVSRLLKPGGLMRLCLYSQYARRPLREAQNLIKDKGYGDSAEELKRFRHDAKSLLKERDYKKIIKFTDYYTLSEFRDLLFHVQEHQYTLPTLKKWFSDENMDFISFFIDRDIKEKYKKLFPEDSKATNLDLWDQFEQQHPDTFVCMYCMLLRKNK